MPTSTFFFKFFIFPILRNKPTLPPLNIKKQAQHPPNYIIFRLPTKRQNKNQKDSHKNKNPSPKLPPTGNLKKQNPKSTRAITSHTNINKTLGNPQISQRGSAGYGLAHRRGSRRKQKGAVLSYCPLLLFEQDLATKEKKETKIPTTILR